MSLSVELSMEGHQVCRIGTRMGWQPSTSKSCDNDLDGAHSQKNWWSKKPDAVEGVLG
jgi:hypothetical protein